YMWGKIDRISPEAPVPIVEIKKREDRLGGAANVVRNLITMGSKPILCSVIGKDKNGEVFLERLESYGLNKDDLVLSEERPTTQKTRVISEQQQVLRVDEESKNPLSENEEIDLLQKVQHYVINNLVDLVILEDYNKGVLTQNVISRTIEWCRAKNIPVTVDPKKENFWAYEGVTLFKPNLREIEDGLKSEIDPKERKELDAACAEIMKRLNAEMAMITLSEHGVYISHKGSSEVIPAEKREIADVSGAGDTVIAVASLCLAAGMDAEHIARLSNLAGGLVCEKVGVVPITADTLLKEAIKLNIGEKKSG
ncbi:MAG: D-glycero-beta-D-manno-heptose-7-phosphate kinase, partial [Flavobacteriales bacterium]|nr:D-glycero-beta-D-manno-heptose-7-phosphate kinase [Flavobacteriales bacterium]